MTRSVVTRNEWSNVLQVKKGVTANANGDFTPSLGYVALAVVDVSPTGLGAVQDLRTKYNFFDPEFFSIYGQELLAIHETFNGVGIYELPFNFINVGTKKAQVEVYKSEQGTIGGQVVSRKLTGEFDLTRTGSGATIYPRLHRKL